MSDARNLRNKGLLALTVILIGLAGCEDDNGGPTAPDEPDIVGEWRYVISNALPQGPVTDGGDVIDVCDVDAFILTFESDNGTLDGTAAPTQDPIITCEGPDVISTFHNIPPLPIVGIDVDGSDVAFDFIDPSAFSSTGSLAANANTMSGTASLTLDFDQGPVEFVGTWTATRQ